MDGFGGCRRREDKNMSNDEDRREPRDIGRIAYEAAAALQGARSRGAEADQAKWNAAARAVLAWACDQMEQEAEYGCPAPRMSA